MQASSIITGQVGPDAAFPAELRASSARMSAPTTVTNIDSQLRAYRALAERWSSAGEAERARLTPVLTTSPFAQRIQSTLNAFTRSAWPGADAPPPAPQLRMLEAFDRLEEVDQKIVAAMQSDGSGAPTYASARVFRSALQTAADQAQEQADAGRERRIADTITLSPEAQQQLAAATSAPPVRGLGPVILASSPELAKAHAAYARASA